MSENNIYANKGLTGLANVGNSCYINTCMQILAHTLKLNNYIYKDTYKNHLNNNPDSIIFVEWINLLKLMWSDNCTIAPMRFINAIRKISKLKNQEIFSGSSQTDAQEFLLFIIDCFHKGISRKVDMKITGNVENNTDKLAISCYNMMQKMYNNDYSEMLNIFYGIHVSVIFSEDETEKLSINPEPFSVLSVSIPEKRNPTIYDCLDEYCKKELLHGDNKWFNDDTKEYQNAKRGIIFWSLPEILIIDIKRWNNNGRKIQSVVNSDLTNLNLSKYIHGYNKELYIYDLYGVCNHSGGMSGGHYTANIKNIDNKWYTFNDTNVSEISESDIITSKAYCLFYRKIK